MNIIQVQSRNVVRGGWSPAFPPPRRPDGRDGEMISYRVVSAPNGMRYGKDGHVPCDHVTECVYPRAIWRLHDLRASAIPHWTREARS